MQNLLDTIRRISGGAYGDKAEEQLAQLVKAVDETGRAGTLTLNIKVSKATKGGAMIITGKHTCKLPPDDEMSAVLFADENGRLTENMPGQDDSKTLFSVDKNKPKIINAGDK